MAPSGRLCSVIVWRTASLRLGRRLPTGRRLDPRGECGVRLAGLCGSSNAGRFVGCRAGACLRSARMLRRILRAIAQSPRIVIVVVALIGGAAAATDSNLWATVFVVLAAT